MRKIFVILFLIFLSGCDRSTPSINTPCNIVLNITSDVIPTITPSHGNGFYDQDKNQYLLSVSNSRPVDISISSPLYETITITIPTSELVQGSVIKDIVFNKLKSAQIEITIETDALLEDIKLSGLDFVCEGNKFTAYLESRYTEVEVEISAGSDYRVEKVYFSLADLSTGLSRKNVFLIKKDQVLITFNLPKYITFDKINNFNNKVYAAIKKKNQTFFIVDKDEHLFYKDFYNSFSLHYLNATKDMVITIKDQNNFVDFIEYNIEKSSKNYMHYYELNNERFHLPTYNDTIYLPYNAQILRVEYNEGNTYLSYHKGFNPNDKTIDLTDFSFEKAVFHPFYIKYYDVFSNQYLEQLVIDDIEQKANSDGYFENTKAIGLIEGYNIIQHDDILTKEVYTEGKWTLEIPIIPKTMGLLLNFVDQNNNPIQPSINEHQGFEMMNDKIFFRDYFISSNLQIDYKYFSIKVFDREYSCNPILFLQMFEIIEINDEMYYQLKTPIVIDSNLYEVWIGINDNSNYYKEFWVNKNNSRLEPFIQTNNLVKSYYFNIGDEIELIIMKHNVQKKVKITWTKEMLEKGMYNYNCELDQEEEIKTINITIGDEYVFVDCFVRPTYPRYTLSSDKKVITLSYLDIEFSLYVSLQYRYKNSSNVLTFNIPIEMHKTDYYLN